MTLPCKPIARRGQDAAPALFRLLSDSALCRTALAACGCPIVLVAANRSRLELTYVNTAFERGFGYTRDEIVGRPLSLLLGGDEVGAREALLATPGRSVDLRLRRRDGAIVPVQCTAACVHDADGTLTHWVVTFVDASELTRLRSELAAMRVRAG